ncbi:MAG: peptidoglycan DD-metalloendopeptidase family protein [Bacteroidales bacterium]|nr:peptidoglycan DD-metalloendopeptidase family protein [Bacteroidales bacterium]
MKYKFNHKSLSFEKAKTTPLQLCKMILAYVAAAVAFAVVVIVIWTLFFESPKEKRLARELLSYNQTIISLEKRVDLLSNVLRDMEEKDDNLYRAILEAEPVKRNLLFNDLEEQYTELLSKNQSSALKQIQLKTNILTQRMQTQLSSYQELWKLAQEKEKIQASIPAISPVKNPTVVSGFGMRYHPIYKILRRHTGVDIIGKKGTPIYATADGVVSSETEGTGYGITVTINHGRGYQTLYAHLSKKNVRSGQRVKRGEIIGFMGNTGLSVGVHLHYEVIKNGEKVNPIHYFFGDLTPEEYNEILKQASEINQSLS